MEDRIILLCCDGMKRSVLFFCTHNSARSQMAEAFLKELYGKRYTAYSAGIEPTQVNPHVIKVMEELGIDLSNQSSKDVEDFRGKNFDYVVTVCDHAKEECPLFPGNTFLHKGFEDPSGFQGTENEVLAKVRRVRGNIREWIKQTFSKEYPTRKKN